MSKAIVLVFALASLGAEAFSFECSDKKSRYLALTFDDGPALVTLKVLDVLRDESPYRHPIWATFFVMGEFFDERSSRFSKDARMRLNQIARDGHWVASHSYSHVEHNKLPLATARANVLKSLELIFANLEMNHRPLFRRYLRFPYGAQNAELRAMLRSEKIPHVGWQVDTLDWKFKKEPEKIAAALKSDLCANQDGKIVLFHDVHESTARVLPSLIRGLIKAGHSFVSIEDARLGKNRIQAYKKGVGGLKKGTGGIKKGL